MKKKAWYIILSILLFSSGLSYANSTFEYCSTLNIDDFEQNKGKNLLNAPSGEWEKDPENSREFTRTEVVEEEKWGEKTKVLKIKYKLTSRDYNGYYSKLNGINGSIYESIEFDIKGGENYPKSFKLELKDNFGRISKLYVSDISNKWEKKSIPLREFRGFNRLGRLSELVIVFEGNIIGNSEGIIYIDDIKLTCPEEKFDERIKEIDEQRKEKNNRIEKILKLNDSELLEVISRKAFNYFWEEASPRTGFIRDRAKKGSPSSIAATGFGLSAICVADYRGWVSREQAVNRVLKTLKSLRDKAEHKNGVYYHFLNMHTGKRVWQSEASPIDTALLMGGVLSVREYFKEKEIRKICDEIYENVNWKWMMDPNSKTLYMGWKPECGFDEFILWDMFGEEMIMYILGLGSPTYPLPAESWHSFRRPVREYNGNRYIFCESESLFTYLYSHAFIDFKNKHDKYADYWKNSLNAIKANKSFAKENKDRFKTYKKGYWGLSACDGPEKYMNYGATLFTHDGTVAIYAISGSMPFMPEKSISTLRKLLKNYGEQVWDEQYGFTSAFNLEEGWFSDDFVGIDKGISLLMIENYRSGLIWNEFMDSKYVKRGLEKAGFEPGTKELAIQEVVEKKAIQIKKYSARQVEQAWDVREDDFQKIHIPESLEYGSVRDGSDLDAEFAFFWDQEHLYFITDVTDNKIYGTRKKSELYKDDCVELYLSPKSNILIWGNEKHFQIGFSPKGAENKPQKYAFFQDSNPDEEVKLNSVTTDKGYKLTASIKWSYLGIKPKKDHTMGMSVAVHDIDGVSDNGKKINWFFKEGPSGIHLGELKLK